MMLVLLYILGALILLFLLWILVAPIILYLNSYTGSYYLAIWGMFQVKPCVQDEQLSLKIKLPFYHYCLDQSAWLESPESKSSKPSKRVSKKESRSFLKYVDLKTITELIQSFHVKHCIVDVDTNDYALNAKLKPVLYAMSGGPVDLRTNFNGNVNLYFEVENRLIRLIRPLIKLMTKNLLNKAKKRWT